jgi:hypothetical protein
MNFQNSNPLSAQDVLTEALDQAMSYPEYFRHVDTLLQQGLHTGAEQKPSYLEYTKLNIQRMRKWEKIGVLSPSLLGALTRWTRPLTWLVITEGWCGDGAQSLPFLHKMALANPHIQLKLVLRDAHDPLMNNYLTHGARSIPKVIWLDENGYEMAIWGPRPQPASLLVRQLKEQGVSPQEVSTQLHTWYALDKGKTLQEEFEKQFEMLT